MASWPCCAAAWLRCARGCVSNTQLCLASESQIAVICLLAAPGIKLQAFMDMMTLGLDACSCMTHDTAAMTAERSA